MPKAGDKVMAMVEEELKKNPDAENSALFEKAKKIDKGIAKLSARQFNARYPLQVKRKLAPPRPRARRRRGAKGAAETKVAVRGVMLDYARAIAAADDMGQVVDLVAGVDKFVDRVLKAAGG